ncbi:TRAP transporter small permease [Bacillus sp. S3]|uniref:TRAP transporter small permease n=1 Tax=Bacillus sp. S3 TaxID=486398 RepID=UPI00118963C0|nr:TRAP transporter small permease [Bacillus sp. S3]QCJ44731.1 TRAP transporter small permease [Bacillus sp. S3]
MKSAFAWLDKNFEPIIMTILFYAITTLITLQVILRFFFQSGFSWAEEVSRFLFVWLMYFSISYLTRNHGHIKISFLVDLLNEKMKKVMMIIVDLIFIAFSIAIFLSAIRICQSVIEFNDRAVTVDVSMNVIYGAGLIGFALIIIRLVQGIVWKVKNFSKPMEYFENERGVYSGVNEICLLPKKSIEGGVNNDDDTFTIR